MAPKRYDDPVISRFASSYMFRIVYMLRYRVSVTSACMYRLGLRYVITSHRFFKGATPTIYSQRLHSSTGVIVIRTHGIHCVRLGVAIILMYKIIFGNHNIITPSL